MRRFFWLVLVACLACITMRAQKTIYVPSTATPTIQSGINAASNGDTVLVDPGIYYENIFDGFKAITIKSSGGAASTIIDGRNLAQTVLLTSATLDGFTVQNGNKTNLGYGGGEGGGGIVVGGSLNASITVRNNIVTDNYCNGMYIEAAGANITSNTVRNTHKSGSVYCQYDGTGVVDINVEQYGRLT